MLQGLRNLKGEHVTRAGGEATWHVDTAVGSAFPSMSSCMVKRQALTLAGVAAGGSSVAVGAEAARGQVGLEEAEVGVAPEEAGAVVEAVVEGWGAAVVERVAG